MPFGVLPRYSSFWRMNIDFIWDFPDYEQFQDVVTNTSDLQVLFSDLNVMWNIPLKFITEISDRIYDYCYGKYINLIDEERWRRNFYGDIGLWVMENGRYFQALGRAYTAANLYDAPSRSKATVDMTNQGAIGNTESSGSSGSDSQGVQGALKDSLTILNNQTTSTNYLASRNEEVLSSGTESQQSAMSVNKSDGKSISLSAENKIHLESENGVLTQTNVAKEESAFNFQPWFEKLETVLDRHFTEYDYHYA